MSRNGKSVLLIPPELDECLISWQSTSFLPATSGCLDMAAREMEARIRAMLPNLKTGSLRIWGQWFGRPHDNIHRIVACSARDNELCLGFDDDETLTVWVPADLTANAELGCTGAVGVVPLWAPQVVAKSLFSRLLEGRGEHQRHEQSGLVSSVVCPFARAQCRRDHLRRQLPRRRDDQGF